ncbi:hypothetical protein GOODEAATRI_029895, partial [Goodea atripinnis]
AVVCGLTGVAAMLANNTLPTDWLHRLRETRGIHAETGLIYKPLYHQAEIHRTVLTILFRDLSALRRYRTEVSRGER